MRLSLRLMGLDVLDLSIETDDGVMVESDDAGDCTTYPVGFEVPSEFVVPDRGLE